MINYGFAITGFQPEDQEAARHLILDGLAEHFGTLDPNKNSDLEDISSHYAGAVFLVARMEGTVVGTGALVPRSSEVAEVVRMSVARSLRRRGIATAILDRLVEHAKLNGHSRVVLETEAAWTEVIQFYVQFGFTMTHTENGDACFELILC